MLAGLSGLYIFRTPPVFWANAGPVAAEQRSNGAAIANALGYRIFFVYLPFAVTRSIVWTLKQAEGYLSSQTSSKRQPLKALLAIVVSPFSWGCQQVTSRA
jgi:hypothetical protein